ncbi:hypothetical protein PHYBOEH_005789 [Phytophthora boehmeriae]|uniref:Transmembrane protein n=1 Tax=Phytophthora boehmeriae TaxID=109152 RepID=A0A8T1X514_9STRA|nr:hypothetical protein PHYBOEH_005789 [Phytophthora boehmeriae]
MESHLFAAALGALAPSFLLLLQFERQWARELPPQCCGVLDRVFWLSSDAIWPHLECMKVSGRALYAEFYAFDLILFPLIYATALRGLLRRLWPGRRLLWTLPVLAALCDVAENCCFLLLLKRFPVRFEAVETAASLFTKTKWVLVFSAAVFVLLAVVKWMVEGWSKRQQQQQQQKKKKA